MIHRRFLPAAIVGTLALGSTKISARSLPPLDLSEANIRRLMRSAVDTGLYDSWDLAHYVIESLRLREHCSTGDVEFYYHVMHVGQEVHRMCSVDV